MKIDKRNCPILFESLSFKNLGLSKYAFTGNEIPNEVIRANEITLKESLKNVMYITHGVIEAFDYGDHKTIDKLLSLRNEIQTVNRTVIWNEGGGITTTIYSIERRENRTAFSILSQQTTKHSNPLNYQMAGYWDHSDADFRKYNIGCTISHPIKDEEQVKLLFVYGVQLIVQCEVFLQYAEIQTKELGPNQKDSIACKYNNKTPFPITIVDSTWYTSLVKSDAFKVRGHFRLQPFGPLMTNRKLIWINEFQKNGYTREAKKLADVLI